MANTTPPKSGLDAGWYPPSALLTKSALDEHDREMSRTPSRLIMPRSSSGSISKSSFTSPTPLTPTDHLRNTSYFPQNLKPAVTSHRRATLTPAQCQAHALGYSTSIVASPGRYHTLPSPPAQQQTGLQSIPEGLLAHASEVPRLASRGNSLATSSNLNTSTSSPSRPTSTAATTCSGSRFKVSTKTHSYFSWSLGDQAQSIYDPDYPEGTPTCNSPRERSTATFGGIRERHSKDNLTSPKKQLYIASEEATQPPDATCSPPSLGSPFPSSASLPRSLSTRTNYPPEEQFGMSEMMHRPLSEMGVGHGSWGSVSDVFGHIASVRPDGTHIDGVIPWAEMHKYVAQAKIDALKKEKMVFELDERLDRSREEKRLAAKRPAGRMESDWIPLGPLKSPSILMTQTLPQLVGDEPLQLEERRRTESEETFFTALSRQESEEDTRIAVLEGPSGSQAWPPDCF